MLSHRTPSVFITIGTAVRGATYGDYDSSPSHNIVTPHRCSFHNVRYVAHNMVRCLGILAADDVSEWPSPNPAAGLAAAYKLLDGELFAGAEPVLAAAKAVGPRMRNPTRKLQKMGTTALTTVTATVDGEKRLYFANLGDCRLVLDRGATKTTEVLTTDHKPSDPAEQARIEANGGVVVNGQLNSEIGVARALGDIKFKKKGEGDDGEASSLISCTAEIGYAVVGAADRFAVIACDGVWDVMSSDEVGEMVRTMLDGGQDQDAICSAVIKECFDRDTKDNMTLALITMF